MNGLAEKSPLNSKRKLLPPEREKLILNALDEGVRTVTELAESLSVSEATVRRDLQALEKQNKAKRVHGGAVNGRTLDDEVVFNEKTSLRSVEKNRIADGALDEIADGDAIFLDGGSTVLALARRLGVKRRLTIVTNSLMAAAELMESAHKLILIGGEFRKLSRTLVGPLSAPVLDQLTVDKAFLGTIGFSVADGLTTTDPAEAYTKELIIRRAKRVMLLADASKFGASSFAKCGSVRDIDCVITDRSAPEKMIRALRKMHIEVVVK